VGAGRLPRVRGGDAVPRVAVSEDAAGVHRGGVPARAGRGGARRRELRAGRATTGADCVAGADRAGGVGASVAPEAGAASRGGGRCRDVRARRSGRSGGWTAWTTSRRGSRASRGWRERGGWGSGAWS